MSNNYASQWKLYMLESSVEGAPSGSVPKTSNEPVYGEDGKVMRTKITREIPITRDGYGFLFVIKQPDNIKPYDLIRYFPKTGEWKFVGTMGVVMKSEPGLEAWKAAEILRKSKFKIKRRVPSDVDLGKI